MTRALALVFLGMIAIAACREDDGARPDDGAGGTAGAPDGVPGRNDEAGGATLAVDVPAAGRAHVALADPPAVVGASDAWDLAFEGFDIFTNSGVSGGGLGGAFGPLDASAFAAGAEPEIPFVVTDHAGGAFVDWYLYAGAPTHELYSRFHVYAVKTATALFKVQILGYYGVPISALYGVRWASLGPDGPGATQSIANLDGTAGGLGAPDDAPSGCLDLASGEALSRSPADARASGGWDLCFRRDAISVDGGLGGPGGVSAADLEAAQTASESLDDVKTRTADGELAAFEAVTASDVTASALRGDRVISAFDGAWLDRSVDPPAPKAATWLVVSADGARHFLVSFDAVKDGTTASPGTVVIRVKPVGG